jgi:uncharacterized RDD family membrane protein YckC
MKTPNLMYPEMMLRILRNRRPRLVGHFLAWLIAGALWALLGLVIPHAVAFPAAYACATMAAVTVLRIVRVNRQLEELE